MGLEAHLSVCTLVTGAKRLVHDGMLTGGLQAESKNNINVTGTPNSTHGGYTTAIIPYVCLFSQSTAVCLI